MQKIIVPVDFSDTSGSALRFGTYLANVLGFDLDVLHIFDANFSFRQATSNSALRAETKRLEDQLKDFVKSHTYTFQAGLQGDLTTLPPITPYVIEGFPARVIRSASEKEDAVLIIMGGVGAGVSSNPPSLFGGVASKIATQGNCPVLLIPRNYGYPQIRTLAMALDGVREIKQMSGLVRELIKVLQPEVNFVHIEDSDPDQELKHEESFLKMASAPGFPAYTFSYHALPSGPVARQLLDYVDEKEIDMLVLGRKQRSFWESLFTKSSLSPVVSHSRTPILIIPLLNTEN